MYNVGVMHRTDLKKRIKTALRRSRVVALIGPRQCGKTTLARALVSKESLNYFDLEDPSSLSRLSEPLSAFRDLRGVVVIDEVQRRPELFPVLRVLADRVPIPSRFLILGSASPELLRQSSESLAGRMETVSMGGFGLAEVGWAYQSRHWRRGGFPLSFLARTEADSFSWRKNFVQTFLERDLPQLGVRIAASALLRFWTMLAHCHGQIWNAAEPARSLGIGETAVRRYLDVLTDVFMVRQLQPWYANLKKRQVKSPKIYFRDMGLLHCLLGISTERGLVTHPRLGASWEGYVVEEVLRAVVPQESFFWATHSGAEIDLVLVKGGKLWGVECKRSDAPQMTPSMGTALRDLSLEHIAVIYPGEKRYPLGDRVTVVPLRDMVSGDLRGIGQD